MDDQILQVGEKAQAETASDLARKLRKREQRLLERLQEAQEKEARALERLRRAGARLERRRSRLGRIKNYLTLTRQQISDLQTADRQPEQVDSAVLAVPVTSEPVSMNGSEANAASVQTEAEIAPGPDTAPGASSAPEVEAETTSDSTSAFATTEPQAASTATAPELVSTPGTVSAISPASGAESTSPADSEQETTRRLEPAVAATPEEATSTEQEDALPASHEQPPDSIPEPEAITPPVAEPVSHEQAPASIPEPEATTPPVAEPVSHEQAPAQVVVLAREAWDAAEAEVLSARNTAHGIASSISFLSQSGGLSNESMAELLRKQSEANKAVIRAQNAARLVYDRFLQVQAEAERAAGQQPGESTGAIVSP